MVLGDFNQRIPRQWAPKGVYEALMRTFEGFEIATEGNLEGAPGLAIGHIAHKPDLVSKGIPNWPDRSADCKRLSDRFGVWADFGLRLGRGHQSRQASRPIHRGRRRVQ